MVRKSAGRDSKIIKISVAANAAALKCQGTCYLAFTVKMTHDFFFTCGYDYKYLEGAEYDFASVSSNPDETLIYASTHPHQLTSFSEPDTHYYFDSQELEALITELRETIAFTCFKKNRTRKNDMDIC